MRYRVLVDDNFHYMDESERYELGQFKTWEDAVIASKRVVDEFLQSEFRAGMNAVELYRQYTGFGEDPFIVPADESQRFSAWDYAEQRCRELCQAPKNPKR